ncbi:MAG: glycosyl hydrolase family 18 protein [Niameybacter sp.]
MPGNERVDPLTYFNEFKEGQLNVVYEDARVDMEKPIIQKGECLYVSYPFAREYIDEKIYYDKIEQIVTITNLQELRRIVPGELRMVVNNEEQSLITPFLVEEDELYIPEDYLEEEYGIQIELGKDRRLVCVSDLKVQKPVGMIKKKEGKLRTHPDNKTLIVDEIEKGHKVIVYKEEDGYMRVRDENGIIGFIPSKDVAVGEMTQLKQDKAYTLAKINKPIEGKVKLVWDQMTSRATGDWSTPKYRNIHNANIIAPTWFEFEDESGKLMDRGSVAYVDAAHARGLQVWALLSHNFTTPELTRTILTSTNKRQYVIDQVLEAARKYGFDGINIDIENVQADFATEWIQFMRELSVQAKRNSVSVSVDVYIPSAWSAYYQRDKLAEVVDYFFVMAYDQHWSGSEQAGPVAGLGWVEEGIRLNLEEVPKEKLVLGIPLYTRIWKETPEGLSSSAYGMAASQSVINRWGATAIYDDAHDQSYVQKIEGDTMYHAWIEDATVVEKRIKLIDEYDLAGYAGWKLGLETSDVWHALAQMEE